MLQVLVQRSPRVWARGMRVRVLVQVREQQAWEPLVALAWEDSSLPSGGQPSSPCQIPNRLQLEQLQVLELMMQLQPRAPDLQLAQVQGPPRALQAPQNAH